MKYLISLCLLCLANLGVAAVQTLPLPHTIALTFDDGPNPIYTPQILAILAKYHIKATFFMVGSNAKLYPEVVRQVYQAGHVVASHSLSHPMLTHLSAQALQHEIVAPQTIIGNILGVRPKCLRYPFGASNSQVRAQIRAAGLMPVPMGYNSFDYERRGTQQLITWVLTHLYNREVLLLHDGYDKREQTVQALPKIIEGIQQKGYGFSTICA